MRFLIAVCSMVVAPLFAMADTVQATDAYVRATLPGQSVASAFVTLGNTSDKLLTLSRIDSTSARTVELHSHEMVNGQMRMRKIENFSIPAHGKAIFRPGDQHIMLIGLSQPLQEGDTVILNMCFDELCSKTEMPVVSVLNEKQQESSSAHQHH